MQVLFSYLKWGDFMKTGSFLNDISSQLHFYIENHILPQYKDDTSGHGITHITYVIRRSLIFAESISNVNKDMVYTIAAYHDLGHSIDPKYHEILSAQLFLEDMNMKEFFTNAERQTIAEAIEDHRASLQGDPRSIYGKIISTADRSTSVFEFLYRTHLYSLKHEPHLTYDAHMERAYQHMCDKYGKNGYAKSYFKDVEYEKFQASIQNLIEHKNQFEILYQNINKRPTKK